MVTEAIWRQNKNIKGSTKKQIKSYIREKWPEVDNDRFSTSVSTAINKMLEDNDEAEPCLIKVSKDHYKLDPEWRKEWTKLYGKKRPQTRKKKKRPEGFPKHPRNAYLYYATEVRKKRQDEYPDKGFGELTTLIADEWKSLKEGKKAPYKKLAEKDKKRYDREKLDWERKHRFDSESSESSAPKTTKRKRSRKSRSESTDESQRTKSKTKRKKKTQSSSSESESDNKNKKKSKTHQTPLEDKDKKLEKSERSERSELKGSSDKK